MKYTFFLLNKFYVLFMINYYYIYISVEGKRWNVEWRVWKLSFISYLFVLIKTHYSSCNLTGSERPTTGFVTEEITSGESSCFDIACRNSSCCIDFATCDFITSLKQQLLVDASIASSRRRRSRCSKFFAPSSSSNSTVPTPVHFA